MKKAISLFLTAVLLLCSFSFLMPAYATNLAQAQLDLSQYTMDDLMNMSAEEYRALLREFERVYDPFDTYDTNPIMEEEETPPRIAPRWASGNIENGEYVEQGSHEYITAKACDILTKDKGFFSMNESANVFIVLAISIASLTPDKDENKNIFEGHFYHAIDGDSWTGSKTNTALVNCRNHFDSAVHAAKVGDIDVMYSELGRALHYIQDAGEPHHAANIVNILLIKTAHGDFETFVDNDIDSYVKLISSVNGYRFSTSSNPSYASVTSHSVDFLVQQTASIAYTFRSQVNNALNKTYWDYAASKTVPNAVGFSALLIYKFAYASGMALY